jgi:hypothetical protein
MSQLFNDPQIVGALIGGGVVAGVVVDKIWSSVRGAGPGPDDNKCKTHCEDHNAMLKTLATVEADVGWLRKKQEEDSTHDLLDGILRHLTKEKSKE